MQMHKLQRSYQPPQLSQQYDFIDEDYFEESDYEDDNVLTIGTHHFRPNWNAVILQNLENINCFCPYCGHFVMPSQQMTCKIQGTKGICLGHKQCVQKPTNQQIQFQYQKSTYTIQKGLLDSDKLTSVLGEKEYVLQATISHPLSAYKYLKMDKKIVMSEGQVLLSMQDDDEPSYSYDLNKIIVPLPQMNIKLEVKEIGSEISGQSINFNVDLSQIFVGIEVTEKHSDWIITTSNSNHWQAKVEIRLIFDQEEKKRQVQMMNFKYSHQLVQNFPLIKLSKILVRSQGYETIMRKSAIQNTKASSNYEDICEEIDEETSSASIAPVMNYPSIRLIQAPKVEKEIKSQSSPFIKDTKMQSSQSLKDIKTFAKTQNGSKELQRMVREMRSSERDDFISEISVLLYEFIQNDYANYMVQTLISCSNSKQRLRVFELLKDHTIELVCLKQGTFAFQQMICFMDTHEEYMMITKLMAQHFTRVVTDPNGNHFLRKLIATVPFWYNEILISEIFANFLQLVNNKNSVCVLKVMLHSMGKQVDSEKIRQLRKKVVEILSLHVEKIIKNEFGNYFIQQAYEVLGEYELGKVSEVIFSRFRQYAKEKFSSSVLCKCISSYWRGTAYYERIKGRMSNSQVIELFKNKEGNKVLLELMFSLADHAFKTRISNVIGNFLPSKFNSSKWNQVTGNKNNRMVSSEPNYLTFSEPMSDYEQQVKISPMAKKRPYIIQ